MFQIRLKQLREDAGLSQYKLAEILGISQSAVGNWEAGTKEPRNYAMTQKIADFFDVSIDYLLGRDEKAPPLKAKSPVYDDEALELMEEMHKRPELKILFQTSRKVKPEAIETINQLMKQLAGNDDEEFADDFFEH